MVSREDMPGFTGYKPTSAVNDRLIRYFALFARALSPVLFLTFFVRFRTPRPRYAERPIYAGTLILDSMKIAGTRHHRLPFPF